MWGEGGDGSFLCCFFLIIIFIPSFLIHIPHNAAVELEANDGLLPMLSRAVAQYLLRCNLHLCFLQASLWLINNVSILLDPGLEVVQVTVAMPGVLSEENIHEEAPLWEEVSGQGLQLVP